MGQAYLHKHNNNYAIVDGNITLNSSQTLNNLLYAGRIMFCTNTSTMTLTVPNDSTSVDATIGTYPIGTQMVFIRTTTSIVNFTPASGVTLNSVDTKRAIKGQHGSVVLLKTAANTWLLVGSLE